MPKKRQKERKKRKKKKKRLAEVTSAFRSVETYYYTFLIHCRSTMSTRVALPAAPKKKKKKEKVFCL